MGTFQQWLKFLRHLQISLLANPFDAQRKPDYLGEKSERHPQIVRRNIKNADYIDEADLHPEKEKPKA